MLKRLALIGAAVAGVVFLRKKAKQQQAEQDLWTQATDDVQAPVPRARLPTPAPAAHATRQPRPEPRPEARSPPTRGHGAIGSAPALQAGG